MLPVVLYGVKVGLGWGGGHRLRVVEDRVLRKIPEQRQFHNKEFQDLYSPPIVIWVIKSRRMRCMECMTRYRGDMKSIQGSNREK
jgi:hypothetical protein